MAENKDDVTGPAKHTIGPHQSDIMNIIDPKVKPDPEKMRGRGGNNTGPAPSTKGPHKSDTANIFDPRVKPDPSHLGNQKKSTEATKPS
ncbi:hypothetical protein KC343_g9995 [Hortaea werneckii]|uniref:Uncharacterized protein n=1 Tax=Hortaea werneckii TaxID=91943 RepID=A0A3M7E5M3_HORWE|nr:hypothetical protein KC338_g6763 [Hortaea werneckii]KAI6864529.1 hypothetical protein KC323_g4698 [Hortaea werneckii]KAI7203940.1 hypothetical protein KC352_g18646 [Hortaea werneckii]KAI7348393.1 hypothetical protein KC320_g6645 [Hortaea werneckii]KAI7559732.1 hypothetical protein KC317_g10177 [Hortaea werneckii]